MFNYTIMIPIRSSQQHVMLARFSQSYLTVGEDEQPSKFLGVPVEAMDCQTGEGGQRAECTLTFRSAGLVPIGGVRQMLKDLHLLGMAVKWCGPGSSGLMLSAVGRGVTYEGIITAELEYQGNEACLI